MTTAAPNTTRKRMKFGLSSMLLIFTIIVISISHIRTSWELNNVHDTATDTTTILLQPGGPFDIRPGDVVTLGVRVKSSSETRFIGLGTNLKVMEIKTSPNMVECVVKTTPELVQRIEAAKDVSMLWFKVVPYRRDHQQTIKNDIPPTEFLAQNAKYRAAGPQDWGYGVAGPRALPPNPNVLAQMKLRSKTNE